MILVDTSVWVDHLRKGDRGLAELLTASNVLMHPFVIGELACGNLRTRDQILALLKDLPRAGVAMDDEVPVRVFNGLADSPEEGQPLRRGQVLLVAVLQKRSTVDELHREPGSTVLGRARVEDPGNAGMVGSGEDLSLGEEALPPGRRVEVLTEDLECDPILDLTVRPVCEVDRTHPAARDERLDSVSADPSAG